MSFKRREEITHNDKLYNLEHDPETQLDWLNELEDHYDELNHWEIEFMLGCKECVLRKKELSERQLEILKKLYNRF